MDNNEYANVLACCKKYGYLSKFPSFFMVEYPDILASGSYSDKDTNLWALVLAYFAEKDDDCQKEISEILTNILFQQISHFYYYYYLDLFLLLTTTTTLFSLTPFARIDKKNLMPPLQVIQILSRSNRVTLSVVKEYITKRIQSESQMVAEVTKPAFLSFPQFIYSINRVPHFSRTTSKSASTRKKPRR